MRTALRAVSRERCAKRTRRGSKEPQALSSLSGSFAPARSKKAAGFFEDHERAKLSRTTEKGGVVTAITVGYIIYDVPIDIDQFEEGDETMLRAGGQTNAERILQFLATHPEQAYTPKEIHEATAVARGSVGVVLSRLEERELVRHRGDYWAITPDADANETLSAMATARAATDRLGDEDPEEWGPGVDAEE
jgi:hypothetical protein